MIYYDKKKNKKILKGIEKVYQAVKGTLGPKPKSAIISFNESLMIIDDGVTIANSIELDNELEKIGAKVLVEAANEMNQSVGDGTTTTIIISYYLIKESFKWISLGKKEEDIIEGIEIAKKMFLEFLDKNVKTVENISELKKVFYVSTGDEEITKLINEALEKIGINGNIVVESSNDEKSSLLIKKGYCYKSGFFVKEFNNKIFNEISNPLVLISDLKLEEESFDKINSIANSRNLLLVVKEIDREINKKIILNNIKNNRKIFVIKLVDDFKEERNTIIDLVMLTKSNFISKEMYFSLNSVSIDDFGTCEKVLINDNFTTFFFREDENKKEYIKELNDCLKKEKNAYSKEELKKRISSINNGVAYIKVGGNSELEIEKRKYKIIDGLKSLEAAKNDGIILGGAITNVKARIEIMDRVKDLPYRLRRGAKILLEASVLPFSTLASNNVFNKRKVLISLKKEKNINDFYVKSFGEGEIYDPMLVLKKAIGISTSIAKTFINTKTIIIKKEKTAVKDEFFEF